MNSLQNALPNTSYSTQLAYTLYVVYSRQSSITSAGRDGAVCRQSAVVTTKSQETLVIITLPHLYHTPLDKNKAELSISKFPARVTSQKFMARKMLLSKTHFPDSFNLFNFILFCLYSNISAPLFSDNPLKNSAYRPFLERQASTL
jgi:hypothetical protein